MAEEVSTQPTARCGAGRAGAPGERESGGSPGVGPSRCCRTARGEWGRHSVQGGKVSEGSCLFHSFSKMKISNVIHVERIVQ